jgi:hypothetical protein
MYPPLLCKFLVSDCRSKTSVLRHFVERYFCLSYDQPRAARTENRVRFGRRVTTKDSLKEKILPAKGRSEKLGTLTGAQKEKQQVQDRVAIGVNVVYEAIRLEGEEELRRTAAALAWSALAAGLSMGFSFIAEALLASHLPDRPWRPLLSRMGYCVGFLVVILGRQQLFTENTLTVILPLLLSLDAADVEAGRASLGSCAYCESVWHPVVCSVYRSREFISTRGSARPGGDRRGTCGRWDCYGVPQSHFRGMDHCINGLAASRR